MFDSLPNCYRCNSQPCRCSDGLTIYNADCREVLPLLEAESIRAVWTDPPYGHKNHEGDLQAARVRDGVKGARRRASEPIANDGAEDMRAVVDSALDLCVPLLTPDCCCCCCCCCGGGPRPTFAWTAERMDRSGLEFFHAVVWDKSDRGNGMGWRFRRNYEFVMVSHRKNGRLAWADEKLAVPNIVRMAPPLKRSHPNEKPVELVRRFLDWTTGTEDSVLDPFMGSGTTLRACKDIGRKGIGIELEEKYCEIAAQRLEQGVLF